MLAYTSDVVTQCTRITDTLEGSREKLISFIIPEDGGVGSATTYPMRVRTRVVALLIAYTTGLLQIKFPSSTAFYPRACSLESCVQGGAGIRRDGLMYRPELFAYEGKVVDDGDMDFKVETRGILARRVAREDGSESRGSVSG